MNFKPMTDRCWTCETSGNVLHWRQAVILHGPDKELKFTSFWTCKTI